MRHTTGSITAPDTEDVATMLQQLGPDIFNSNGMRFVLSWEAWLNRTSWMVADSKRSTGARTLQRQRQMSASFVFIPHIEENSPQDVGARRGHDEVLVESIEGQSTGARSEEWQLAGLLATPIEDTGERTSDF
jgi:hypothetical protein